MSIAATPAAPYYAVIFTSLRRVNEAHAGADAGAPAEAHDVGDDDDGDGDGDGYADMAALMLATAARQPGFLGVESARETVGITVSYWASLEAISQWKQDSEHLLAQRLGREHWYEAYQVRVCRVEREYGFERQDQPTGSKDSFYS